MARSRCRLWPEEVITIAALPEVDLLPAPAADHFRYNRIIRSARQEGQAQAQPRDYPLDQCGHHRVDHASRAAASRQPKAKSGKTGKSANPSPKDAAKPRNTNRPGANDPIGHQIQITQPQASLAPPSR